MRTGSNFRNNYYSKNATRLPNVPSVTMRLMDSTSPGVDRTSTCYIIYEEQSVEVDENCNETQKEKEGLNKSDIITNPNLKRTEDITGDKGTSNKNLSVKNSSDLLNFNNSTNERSNDYEVVNSLSLSQSVPTNRRQFSNISSTEASPLRPELDDASLSELQHQNDKTNSKLPETKSGHLILIISPLKNENSTHKPDSSLNMSSRTFSPTRSPVIVKIHGKSYNKYAIVSSTRRHQPGSSFCLKLKNSRVTQSTTSSSRFSVVIDGDNGKTFNFEASNSQMAQEWIYAFSAHYSNYQYGDGSQTEQRSGTLQTARNTKEPKLSPAVLKLSNIPVMPALSESVEEEEEQDEEEEE